MEERCSVDAAHIDPIRGITQEDRRRFYPFAKMWLHVNKRRYVTEQSAVGVIPEKIGRFEDPRKRIGYLKLIG